jgi:hypothetical protein
MTACFATGSRLLLVAGVLAGCQSAPKSAARPPHVQFEVTDLSNPGHPSTVTVHNGTAVYFPILFNIVVRAVGTDPAGVLALQTYTTSYTAHCNEGPIPEIYRTKLIVLPEGVTSEPSTPTRQSYKLPLDTLTLSNIGLCEAPAPTSFHFQAWVLNANNVSSGSDLTIHVGNAPVSPAGG